MSNLTDVIRVNIIAGIIIFVAAVVGGLASGLIYLVVSMF